MKWDFCSFFSVEKWNLGHWNWELETENMGGTGI